MSAFMVEDECIGSIVGWIEHAYMTKTYPWSEVARDLGEQHCRSTDGPSNLGRAMYAMNRDAIAARYGLDACEEMGCGAAPDDWTFAPVRTVATRQSAVVIHKRLQCFMYQCSEGDNHDRTLYKALESFSDALAHAIVSSLPEYDSAPWG